MYLKRILFGFIFVSGLILLSFSFVEAQTIVSVTNRDDPFGPLPDTTTNFIELSANDDLVDIIYTTTTPPSIVRRFYNAVTGSLNQVHIWNGQDDAGANCSPGTYNAKIKLNRIASYSIKLPPNNNFVDFSESRDITCDQLGNVYVIDYQMSAVEKFSPTGILILKFGSPGTGNGEFNNPLGITVDTNGFIYVSDDLGATGRIQQFKPDGTYTNSYTSATYNNPQGMGYDPLIHRIYFVCTGSDDIIRLNPDTMTFDDSNTTLGNVNPTDIAIDPVDSDLYVVTAGNRVRRWTRTRFENNQTQANSWWMGAQQWWGITVRSNYYYIASRLNHRIQQRDNSTGGFIENSGSLGDGNGEFNTPYSIAYDSANNYLWVSDTGNKRLVKLTDNGTMAYADSIETDPKGIIDPGDIALDDEGNVYVCDTGHYCVKKFDKFGNFIMEIGSYGSTNGRFQDIRGIAVDDDYNIYVSDYLNDNIQKFDSSGTYMTQWSVIDPQGMCISTDRTNIWYIRNRGAAPANLDNRMVRMNKNGVTLQDFWLSLNDISYYDLDVNSQGYVYCINLGGGTYIDRYLPASAGNTGPTWVGVGNPNGIAIDDFDTLWVPRGADNVRAYNFSMQQLYQFGSSGSANGQFDNPENAAITVLDLPGEWANLWVVDSDNNRIQKFIINWGSEYTEPVTIANAGSPFVSAAYPDDASSSNVNNIDGTRYVRAGKTYFEIYFSQQMNTNISPSVKFTYNAVQYTINEVSYINNVWIGTAWINSSMGEGTATFYISGAQNTAGSNIDPDPDLSYNFIIDTIAPNPPFIEQPVSPTTFTNITVNGSTESEIRVNVYNYSASSGGTLISYQSNILSDIVGDFTATDIDLLTPKPSTNYITAVAKDKAGNWSTEYTPRRIVRCINSGGGTGSVTPDEDKYLGDNGNPNLVFNWTADAYMQSGTVVIKVPSAWAGPSLTSGTPGYVRISDSYNITFTGSPTNLQVQSNQVKICFTSALPGGYFEITYGTNNLTMVSNNALIGVNDFVMTSTNNDPNFRNNWDLPLQVYPTAGKKLSINVKTVPVLIHHDNLLPSSLYIGQSFIEAFNISFTNQNQYYINELQKLIIKTMDTNDNFIVPSTAISRVYLYTNGAEFYVDSSIEIFGDTITLDFSPTPLDIFNLSKRELKVILDISDAATANSLKLGIISSNDFVVKDKTSQVLLDAQPWNDSFPMFSTNAGIGNNQQVEYFGTSFSNNMPLYVDSSGQDVAVVNYTFYNTNNNGNDLQITELRMRIENSLIQGIVPSSVVSRVVVEDIKGAPVYLIDNTIEGSGDTITLDLFPANLFISANTSKTVSIVLDITSTPSATNFQIALTDSTNVKAEDDILSIPATNYAYPSYSFPMRGTSADIADHFLILHDNLGNVDQWEDVVIQVLNVNNNIVKNYNGVITLDTDGTPSAINWTNQSGGGTVNNIPADDKAIYNFSLTDNGVVTLAIIDSTSESVNVSSQDEWINDDDTEGYLFFQGMPRIDLSKSVYPPKARPFETLTYTIRYSNISSFTSANVDVVEALPVNLLLMTNSSEISNAPHAGSVAVYYGTNYTNNIWLNANFDSSTTISRIKKIRWIINTPLPPSQSGTFKFKVIIR